MPAYIWCNTTEGSGTATIRDNEFVSALINVMSRQVHLWGNESSSWNFSKWVGASWYVFGLARRSGPGVSLLCCFVVYSTRRFVVFLSVCHLVLVFFGPFGIAIASLGEGGGGTGEGGWGGGGWSWCFSYVCSVCACLDLSVSSSSWGLGRAAVCDCGTPWTFLLPFLVLIFINS